MPQDQNSGAQANRWGRETARKIMRALNAKPISTGSNECMIEATRVVIKCAAPNTKSIGVSYKMLQRINCVIGALAYDNYQFDLYKLSIEVFRKHMTPTRSKGASMGKVGIVNTAIFASEGMTMGRVTIK